MRINSCLRTRVRCLGASLALLLGAGPVLGSDVYVPSDGLLTMSSVSIGSATYTNMTVSVGSIVTPPSGSTPLGAMDSYNPYNRHLVIQQVLVGNTTYYNAVVTATDLVGVADVSGADSYGGGQLFIPAVQVGATVYTDVLLAVTPADIVSVNRGMPAAPVDSYDPATALLSISGVSAGGHAYTNVKVHVTPASILSVGGHHVLSTNVVSTGFNSNGTTTTTTASAGAWVTYFQGSNTALIGGSGGGYADQGTNPTDEFVYVNDTLANLGSYTTEGVGIRAATDIPVSTAGTGKLSFALSVNPEWFQAGANFVVVITSRVPGVSGSACDPGVAAVVAATAGTTTVSYLVPLTAFDSVVQNCGTPSVTAAQVLAGSIVGVDFQADGMSAAITASGLTSTSNTTVISRGAYRTAIDVVGAISFVP